MERFHLNPDGELPQVIADSLSPEQPSIETPTFQKRKRGLVNFLKHLAQSFEQIANPDKFTLNELNNQLEPIKDELAELGVTVIIDTTNPNPFSRQISLQIPAEVLPKVHPILKKSDLLSEVAEDQIKFWKGRDKTIIDFYPGPLVDL